MVSQVQEHLDEIRRLCRKYHVAQLYVFGSAVTDMFVPGKSDVDFLVRFDEMVAVEHKNAYFGLLFDLEAMIDSMVDLVEEQAICNPYFLEEIEDTKVELYAA